MKIYLFFFLWGVISSDGRSLLPIISVQLRQMVERFGPVKSAALMKDLRTGVSMGCGVVEFENPKDIDKAVQVSHCMHFVFFS